MLSFVKKHPIETAVLVGIVFLVVWRIVAWYFPLNGAKTASFFDGDISFSIQELLRSETQGEVKIRGNAEGENLVVNAPNASLLFSEDAGNAWQSKGQLGGWNDILVLPDGTYYIVETTIAGQNLPGTIRYRSSENPASREIYKAGMSNNGLLGKEIRGVDIEKGTDGFWLLFREGISNEYEYKLLFSSDGVGWRDTGRVSGIKNPDELQLVSVAIDPRSNTKYITTIEWDEETVSVPGMKEYVFEANPQLMLLQKGTSVWKKLQENLGEAAPGKGFSSGIPFDAKVFTDSAGNILIFWRQHFSKPQATSFLFPLDAIKHVPILKIAYGFFATYITKRDEIYFAKISQDGVSSDPVRLNEEILENRQVLKLGQTGTEAMKEMQERIARYGIGVKSSVSENGQYLGAFWTDYREEGKKPLYLSYSKDGGKTWSKNQAIYPELSNRAIAFDIFVSNSGVIHLIFSDP